MAQCFVCSVENLLHDFYRQIRFTFRNHREVKTKQKKNRNHDKGSLFIFKFPTLKYQKFN